MIAPTVILKCAEKKLKFMVVEKENSGSAQVCGSACQAMEDTREASPGGGEHVPTSARWNL